APAEARQPDVSEQLSTPGSAPWVGAPQLRRLIALERSPEGAALQHQHAQAALGQTRGTDGSAKTGAHHHGIEATRCHGPRAIGAARAPQPSPAKRRIGALPAPSAPQPERAHRGAEAATPATTPPAQ